MTNRETVILAGGPKDGQQMDVEVYPWGYSRDRIYCHEAADIEAKELKSRYDRVPHWSEMVHIITHTYQRSDIKIKGVSVFVYAGAK